MSWNILVFLLLISLAAGNHQTCSCPGYDNCFQHNSSTISPISKGTSRCFNSFQDKIGGGQSRAEYNITVLASDTYAVSIGWVDSNQPGNGYDCGAANFENITVPLQCGGGGEANCVGSEFRPIPEGRKPAVRVQCVASVASCSFQTSSLITLCSSSSNCDQKREYTGAVLNTAGQEERCFATGKDQPFPGGTADFKFNVTSLDIGDSYEIQIGYLPQIQDVGNHDCASFSIQGTNESCSGTIPCARNDPGISPTPDNSQPAFKVKCVTTMPCNFDVSSKLEICAQHASSCDVEKQYSGSALDTFGPGGDGRCFATAKNQPFARGPTEFSFNTTSNSANYDVYFGYLDAVQDVVDYDCASFQAWSGKKTCFGATECAENGAAPSTPDGKQPAFQLICQSSLCEFSSNSSLFHICAQFGNEQDPCDALREYNHTALSVGGDGKRCFPTEQNAPFPGGSADFEFALDPFSGADTFQVAVGYLPQDQSVSDDSCTAFQSVNTTVCAGGVMCSGSHVDVFPTPPGMQPAFEVYCTNTGSPCNFQSSSMLKICATHGCDEFQEYKDSAIDTSGNSSRCFPTQKDRPLPGGSADFEFSLSAFGGGDTFQVRIGYVPQSQEVTNDQCSSFTPTGNTTACSGSSTCTNLEKGISPTPPGMQPAFQVECSNPTGPCNFQNSFLRICANHGGGTCDINKGYNSTALDIPKSDNRCFVTKTDEVFFPGGTAHFDFNFASNNGADTYDVSVGYLPLDQSDMNDDCAPFQATGGPFFCSGAAACISNFTVGPIPFGKQPGFRLSCTNANDPCTFKSSTDVHICGSLGAGCDQCTREQSFCEVDGTTFPPSGPKCFPLGASTGGGVADYSVLVKSFGDNFTIAFGSVVETQLKSDPTCSSFQTLQGQTDIQCQGQCNSSLPDGAVPLSRQPAIRISCLTPPCFWDSGGFLSMCSSHGGSCEADASADYMSNELSTPAGAFYCFATEAFAPFPGGDANMSYSLGATAGDQWGIQFGYLPDDRSTVSRSCAGFTSPSSQTNYSGIGPFENSEYRSNTPMMQQPAFRIHCQNSVVSCNFSMGSFVEMCANHGALNPTTMSPTGVMGPTTLSPTTDSPTNANPTTLSPTTDSPTNANPTTLSPTTDSPTTSSPTTESPTTSSPTTESPTTSSPTTESPTTSSPTTESPTTSSPTTESPTTSSPTTESPTTSSPTTESPTTSSPTTGSPTTASPTTISPTPLNSTTNAPSMTPTSSPTFTPSILPSANPSASPSSAPSIIPTIAPSNAPTSVPSENPSVTPTSAPTQVPTSSFTKTPVASPTATPSTMPTSAPTVTPCLVNCSNLPLCAVGTNPNSVNCLPECVYDCIVPPPNTCVVTSTMPLCTVGDLACLRTLPLCGICESPDSLTCRTILFANDTGGCSVDAQSTCYEATTLCNSNEVPVTVDGSCCPTCIEANDINVDPSRCVTNCTSDARCEIPSGATAPVCVSRVKVSLTFPVRAQYAMRTASWWTGWFRTIINAYCQGRAECSRLRTTIASLVAEAPAQCANQQCTLVLTFEKQNSRRRRWQVVQRQTPSTSADVGIFPDALPTDEMVAVIADAAEFSETTGGGATGTTFSVVIGGPSNDLPLGAIIGGALGAIALGVGIGVGILCFRQRQKMYSTKWANEAIRLRRESALERMRDDLKEGL